MASIANRLEPLFDRRHFPVTLLVVAIVFSACLMPAQSDTWWQLRTGEEIWRSGRIVLQDDFTHTVSGQPWPNHEWLTQVLFYAVYAAGGLPLLTLLCAAAITVAWWIVLSLTPGPVLFRVALVGGGAAWSSVAWSLRPQVLTMALFAATLCILVRRRYLWSLPPLFLVWANLHGAVALGGVLIVAAALASLRAGDGRLKALIAIGGLCFVATTLTPLGVSLWLELPQMLQRSEAYGIQEWRAANLSTWADAAFWATGGSVIALAVVKRRALQSVQTLTLVIAAVFLFLMTARSVRHFPSFFLCAVPTIAVLLNVVVPHKESVTRRASILRNAVSGAACAVAAAFFIAYAWSTHLPRLRWDPVPSSVLSAIDDCRGPLYNRYNDGGALLWFAKHRKIFIDSRQDPFPTELVLEHIQVEQSGNYRQLFERYHIDCALTNQGRPLAARLRRDGWLERRAAGTWTVYSRPSKQIAVSPL